MRTMCTEGAYFRSDFNVFYYVRVQVKKNKKDQFSLTSIIYFWFDDFRLSGQLWLCWDGQYT